MRQGWVPISLSETNPAGLAAGSRWSARGKGADHRENADKNSCTQKGCQNCCQPVFDLTRTGADFTSKRAVLASLQDARISSPHVRGSLPLLPRTDPRLPATNPAGLDWSAETNGKTSRKSAPACTNPSLMQPWPPGTRAISRSRKPLAHGTILCCFQGNRRNSVPYSPLIPP